MWPHGQRAIAFVTGASDYSYQRPSRRQVMGSKVIYPSMVRPVARVAVVVDTSGSMGAPEVDAALGEVKGILREVGVKSPVTVMAVDTMVHTTKAVTSVNDVRLAGGGGTDMGAGLRAAERLRPAPDVVVILTDGYTPWPQQAPAGFTTIVVLLGTGDATTPGWARTVRRDAA